MPIVIIFFMNTKHLGRLGEDIAVKYLKKKGYKILQRNFERKTSRFLKSEIDIVAKRDNIISFIEVKSLRNGEFIAPEQKVGPRKKRKLIRTGEAWLIKNKVPIDSKWQIDIISIIFDLGGRSTKLSHFENIVDDKGLF